MNTESATNVLTRQWRIAEIAKQNPDKSLNSIHHHLDLDWLRVAYERLQKDKAPGYDGETVQEYGKDLDSRLTDLLARAKRGSYYAPPVKRVHIPKGNGKETRPIGIPTTEDKVLQRAVAMLLEPIYEEEFLDFSYGFRPGRSAHQALDRIWKQVMNEPIQWIVEVDIRKFFDSNIFLHEVLDKWFEQTVKPRLHGRAFLVRFADDFVMGFQKKDDAERVYQVLPRRFEKYGLKINLEKTRVVRFTRPGNRKHQGKAKAICESIHLASAPRTPFTEGSDSCPSLEALGSSLSVIREDNRRASTRARRSSQFRLIRSRICSSS